MLKIKFKDRTHYKIVTIFLHDDLNCCKEVTLIRDNNTQAIQVQSLDNMKILKVCQTTVLQLLKIKRFAAPLRKALISFNLEISNTLTYISYVSIKNPDTDSGPVHVQV